MTFFYKSLRLAALFLSFSLPLFSKGLHDFRIWSYEWFLVPLKENFDFLAEFNFRWRDDASFFHHHHVRLELPIRLSPHLILGPGYRQIWIRESVRAHWRIQYEPQLNIALTGTWKWITWMDRHRIAYRLYDRTPIENRWQYRNRFTLEPAHQWAWLGLHPFIWDEIFVEEHEKGIFENRFFCGLRFNLLKCLQEEMGYMHQIRRAGVNQWEYNEIFVINFRALF